MNRRSFFQRVGIFVTGCALAVGLEYRQRKVILNPDWINAPFEMAYLLHNKPIKAGDHVGSYERVEVQYPPRYDLNMRPVATFIEVDA